jgi:TonB family protein
MMRLWMTSYARPARQSGAGTLSAVAHVAIIAAWVVATLPPHTLPSDSITNRLYYIPPPDRPPLGARARETIRYVTAAPGLGSGPGPAAIDDRRPIALPERSADPGERTVDTLPTAPPAVVGAPTGDSVFTILEVDTAVVRSQSSAAPAYPLALLEKKIEGMVLTRYVVDTTGFADTTSFEVIRSTHPGFVQAVREALPYMRFSPAKIGSVRVRQLVEQPFTFKITPAVAATKP